MTFKPGGDSKNKITMNIPSQIATVLTTKDKDTHCIGTSVK